jgi:hypothetical protein
MNLIINPQLESLCPPLSEERDAACDEVQEARAEADHAKADQVRMVRDVATMFKDMRAVADKHAELHAARARLQAELEQARRPWWYRRLRREILLGRVGLKIRRPFQGFHTVVDAFGKCHNPPRKLFLPRQTVQDLRQ